MLIITQRIRVAVYKNVYTAIVSVKNNTMLRSGKVKARTEGQNKEGERAQDIKPRLLQSSLINKALDFT